MTDEGGSVTMEELLVFFFKHQKDTQSPWFVRSVFSSALATLGLLKD